MCAINLYALHKMAKFVLNDGRIEKPVLLRTMHVVTVQHLCVSPLSVPALPSTSSIICNSAPPPSSNPQPLVHLGCVNCPQNPLGSYYIGLSSPRYMNNVMENMLTQALETLDERNYLFRAC